MSDNLLKPGEFYYHPLTRVAPPPRVFSIDAEGNEIVSAPIQTGVRFKKELTLREVVAYFYNWCGVTPVHQNFPRDEGGVRFIIKKLGLDVALFCIDSLISDHLESDDRTGYAPEIITASNYTDHALDRLGQVKAVAAQYDLLDSKSRPLTSVMPMVS